MVECCSNPLPFVWPNNVWLLFALPPWLPGPSRGIQFPLSLRKPLQEAVLFASRRLCTLSTEDFYSPYTISDAACQGSIGRRGGLDDNGGAAILFLHRAGRFDAPHGEPQPRFATRRAGIAPPSGDWKLARRVLLRRRTP